MVVIILLDCVKRHTNGTVLMRGDCTAPEPGFSLAV